MEPFAVAAWMSDIVKLISWISYLFLFVVMFLGAIKLSWFPHYLSFDSPVFWSQYTLVLLGFPAVLAEYLVTHAAHEGADHVCWPFWKFLGTLYIIEKGVMYVFLNLKARAASGGLPRLHGLLYRRVLFLATIGILGIPILAGFGAWEIHGEMIYDLEGYGNFCSVRCPAWLAGTFAVADTALSILYFLLFYIPIRASMKFSKQVRIESSKGTLDMLWRNLISTTLCLLTCSAFMGVVIYTSAYPTGHKILVTFPLAGNIDVLASVWFTMYATHPAWKFEHLKAAQDTQMNSSKVKHTNESNACPQSVKNNRSSNETVEQV